MEERAGAPEETGSYYRLIMAMKGFEMVRKKYSGAPIVMSFPTVVLFALILTRNPGLVDAPGFHNGDAEQPGHAK